MTSGFKLDLRGSRRRAGLGRWILGGLGLVGWGLAATRAAPPETRPVPEFRRIAPLAGTETAARAHGLNLEGMVPPDSHRRLRVGDGVTVLVSLTEGKKLRQWLIDLEATQVTAEEQQRPFDKTKLYSSSGQEFSFSGGRAALTIRVIGPIDAAAAARGQTTPAKMVKRRILVSADFLSLGLDRVPAFMLRLKALHEKDPKFEMGKVQFGDKPYPAEVVEKTNRQPGLQYFPVEDQKAFIGSLIALREFLVTIARTPGLQDVMMSAVDIPWWSIIRSLGHPSFGLEMLQGVRALKAGTFGLSAADLVYTWPFRLTINGKESLLLQLAVVPPDPPLTVTAGVIGIAAGQPSGKGPELRINVVSTRAGAP